MDELKIQPSSDIENHHGSAPGVEQGVNPEVAIAPHLEPVNVSPELRSAGIAPSVSVEDSSVDLPGNNLYAPAGSEPVSSGDIKDVKSANTWRRLIEYIQNLRSQREQGTVKP